MTENHSFEEGGKSCLTLAGLGKLAPNMLLIGFKTNWSKDLENAAQYFNILEVSWEVNTQNLCLRYLQSLYCHDSLFIDFT